MIVLFGLHYLVEMIPSKSNALDMIQISAPNANVLLSTSEDASKRLAFDVASAVNKVAILAMACEFS